MAHYVGDCSRLLDSWAEEEEIVTYADNAVLHICRDGSFFMRNGLGPRYDYDWIFNPPVDNEDRGEDPPSTPGLWK